ncbi:molecular chaperone HtpG [Anaerococcus hydrogenalis]|uniref:Chaperone protein HtpG n=1 Tax=Anaerococcus hydrogenalis TaxID=33029 RepID=A0A2N6UIW6_9FIRM|nr:molecular chaperone HtpG [Anaerococcus hydrogenalis]MDK7694861.1 molecular chaperone HtpG [Anaerococcus hydrogenalis]MDK7696585.1 molecular chaperone HtpG [Anaerococcus hydrogenalis]MDK7707888.1 molecular chaperone HtpG [Anaerococcus hydrogenalis]PMC81495.1 molecular chaperone HtpG [Anaerococcus hydrogenalis]
MKKEFKAEAKKVMDLMINSIYTNKDIFLRELISNGSDAIDKLYYKDLKSDKNVDKKDYYIEIIPNKEKRSLTIRDTGIGMDEKDLEENLGTIAKSGTEIFKKDIQGEDLNNLIGQFGVGFYSAFMVSDKIVVNSKKDDQAYKWISENAQGYEIEKSDKKSQGTDITLFLKENSDDENYDIYLDQYKIKELIRKYSNYIRYPIKMEVTKSRKTKDSTDEDPKYEDYSEVEVLNSEIPIWKKSKKDLTDDDYINFYKDQGYGFDDPLSWLHLNIEGTVEFRAIIYIPRKAPFDFYSKDYQKGLELYSSGVKIKDRHEDLLDDEFAFAKGVVESDDISLNISRETLQETRELRFIAKQINNKIKSHLLDMMKNDREKYQIFFKEFGNNIKGAIYESYGAKKDRLEDLLLFNSYREDKLISLKEYKDKMKSTDENILYTVGENLEKIKNSPALKSVDDDKDVLLLDQKLDEFLIKMLNSYKDISFKSINEVDENEEVNEENKDLIEKIKEILPEEVVDVKISQNLSDDVISMIKQKGDVSIEMEKTLKDQVNAPHLKAQKVLEINKNSKAYELLEKDLKENSDEFKMVVNILFDQAKLIEGLEIENPLEYAKNIWKLI